METLISLISAVLDFFSATIKFFTDLVKPIHGIWNTEVLMMVIMLVVTVAGIAANGLLKPRRKYGERPSD